MRFHGPVVACALGALGARPVAGAEPDSTAGACIDAYELAHVERAARKWAESLAHFRQCAVAACPRVVSDECAKWVAETERAVATSAPLPLAAARAESPPVVVAPEQGPRAGSSSALVLPVVLGGVGVVGLGGFTYFGLKGTNARDEMASTCRPHCDSGDVDRARLHLTLANVSLGVGLVALGAGAYFFFSRAPQSKPAAFVGVTPIAGGVTTSVSGRF